MVAISILSLGLVLAVKVLIALNTSWNLLNFRSGLIRELVGQELEVVGVAPSDDYVADLEKLGCRHIHIRMDGQGTNPLRDVSLQVDYLRILELERPDVVLAYTVKPNIYGSLAAHFLGIPVINNIAGLGAVFTRRSALTFLVKRLYRLALSRSSMVFFQNAEDQEQFLADRIVGEKQSGLLPGSGVDLKRFPYTPLRSGEARPFRFLLVARMLWDKGIGEFVDAARRIKQTHPDVEFCLLGFLDVDNPSAISQLDIDTWVTEGVVKYLGVSNDVRQELAEADCVVLPSFYREGTPRSLLEAAAMGRPIITTDTIGCRNVVEDGVSGFLCRPRDAHDLADKMIRMIHLNHEERCLMGEQGRRKIELEYDERIVIERYMRAIEDAVTPRPIS